MATLSFSRQAIADLELRTDFLVDASPSAATETTGLIAEAVALLARHPLIGRPLEHEPRELVISRMIDNERDCVSGS
ncbi:MAG: type II toxin-antitoxin system RelE/ParE family toxin [Burkholderiales bacterium]